jgi:hypothetical protein
MAQIFKAKTLVANTGKFAYEVSAPNLVYNTGNQNIDGSKNFYIRPTVNGTGVLLSGDIPYVQTNSYFYVDRTRTDSYVENGNILYPYKTLNGAYEAAKNIASFNNPTYITLLSPISEDLTINKGYINLDDRRSGKGYSYQIFDGGNNVIKSGYTDIPASMVRYIKGELTAPNEGDLVTLEKEEENPNPTRNLTKQEETVLKLFSRNEGYKPLSLVEIATFSGYPKDRIIDVVFDLQTYGYVVVVDPDKKILRYELTQTGKNAIANMSPVSASTVPVSAVTLTSAEQQMVDYLALNGAASINYIIENLKNLTYVGQPLYVRK